MVESIPDMPAGTYGFRSVGKLTADDYRDVMLPPLRAAVERGERIRLLFEMGHDFGETPGGLWEDVKSGASLAFGGHWERTALVTDLDWARRAVTLLGWMSPGEVRLFGAGELDDAKRWLVS